MTHIIHLTNGATHPLTPGDILSFDYTQKRFMARAIQAVTRSPFTHSGTYLGDGKIGEACSSGYKINPLEHYFTECDEIAIRPFTGNQLQQARVKDFALAWADRRLTYGWLDVIALGLARYGIKPGPVARRLRSSSTLFCSQACAILWRLAGVALGVLGSRPEEEITPADLAFPTPGVVYWNRSCAA